MRTSSLFDVKNFGFFKIYGVSARTMEGVNFSRFLWTASTKITIGFGK